MPRVYANFLLFILLLPRTSILIYKGWGRVVPIFWRELAIAIAVVGTMIGAGFASGQELVRFFLVLGSRADEAVILMGGLLTFMAAWVRRLALQWRTRSYHDFLSRLLGSWEKPADLATALFLFGGLAVMLAGSGALVKEYFRINPLFGMAACGLLSLLACLGQGRGLIMLNLLLVPVMLITIVTVVISLSLSFAASSPPAVPAPAQGLIGTNWLLNTFLYVAYNMIGITVLLTSLPSTQKGTLGAAGGGIFIGVLAFFLVKNLATMPTDGLEAEFPLLYMVSIGRAGLVKFYVLALWLALATTAASNLYGLAARFAQFAPFIGRRAPLLLLAFSLPLAGCGFANLISWVYPFFGYICLIFLVIAWLSRL